MNKTKIQFKTKYGSFESEFNFEQTHINVIRQLTWEKQFIDCNIKHSTLLINGVRNFISKQAIDLLNKGDK